MTVLEIGLAAVLITENLAILLISMWNDRTHDRDLFGERLHESMRRKS